MTKINLKTIVRDETGNKMTKKRAEGLLPAVVYGHGIKPINVWINNLDFEKVYRQAGENTIIEIDTGGGARINVLIQDIQTDPTSGRFIHADLFQVRMDEKIEKEVPLEFTGESPAVKEAGGILVKSLDEVPVKCLPSDLPSKLEVNISSLKNFDDYIKVKDLKIEKSVQLLIDPETIVALVTPPRSDEEIAKLDEKVEEDISKVEGLAKETSEKKDSES